MAVQTGTANVLEVEWPENVSCKQIAVKMVEANAAKTPRRPRSAVDKTGCAWKGHVQCVWEAKGCDTEVGSRVIDVMGLSTFEF